MGMTTVSPRHLRKMGSIDGRVQYRFAEKLLPRRKPLQMR